MSPLGGGTPVGNQPGMAALIPIPITCMESVVADAFAIINRIGSAALALASDFATTAQGAKADSALQSVPDAAAAIKGVILKAAALTAPAGGALVNNTGGSVGTTLAAIPVVGTVLSVAVNVTDFQSFRTAVMDGIASLAAAQNLTRSRVEDLIAKQQTAGQQT